MCRGIITYRLNTLRQIADGVILSDDDIALLRQAIRKLKLWVTPRDAPVDDIVQTGIVPRLVQLFNVDDFPDRFEALLILGYLTRSGNTTLLINSNVLPLFLGHLHSDRDREEQRLLAVWALGNIAKYPQVMRGWLITMLLCPLFII
ncbi:importin subunit alpha-6 isoform X2 [Brassica rapa]|uniref:importin subunit alpha-6 isoform X2 n=1 Tax=Brassica campestris TaxID=3711 RepID=UPI0008720F38|nr:importin subunit alpha-6 isoform X2 [Brassica rapa]